ncbi:MAG: hypothetical protein R6U57_11010 [Anaerolineales bacterium]
MKTSTYFLLFLISASIVGLTSAFQEAPGYMDADYYYATALRIVNGKGMTEPFLWNYLGEFDHVIHPSHAYWPPLVTWISALGMTVLGRGGFFAGKAMFLFIAALVPPTSAHLAYKLSGRKKTAVLAGLLACFPLFYLPFLTVTDSFGPLMLLGAAFFLSLEREDSLLRCFLLGLVVGAIHLTRAEGIIWVAIAVLALYIGGAKSMKTYGVFMAGYLLIFGPWMARNIWAFGSPFGTGGFSTLWIRDYDQLFVYPAEELTFSNWLNQGMIKIMRDRCWSLSKNGKTAIAIQGQLILFPLLIVGVIDRWQKKIVRVGVIAWMALFGLMTVIFPFQGARGGFFHAGAALQPLIWALSAVGFSKCIRWGVERRSWIFDQAWKILSVGLILILLGTSIYIVKDRVIGDDVHSPKWNASYQTYKAAGETLLQIGAEKDVIMINNPPGFFVANRVPSIVVPDGDLQTLLEAARRYQAAYLVLDRNVPQGLTEVYKNPQGNPGLTYLQTKDGVHYFKIEGVDEDI